MRPGEMLELAASEVRRRAALPGDEAGRALRLLADELDELRGLLLAPPQGKASPGRVLRQAIEASGVAVEVVTPVDGALRFPVPPEALAAALRRLVLVASRGLGERGVALECRPATSASVLLTLRPRGPGGGPDLGLGRLRLDLDLALARALVEGVGGAVELEASGDRLLAVRVELPADPDSVADLRARLVTSALAAMRDELGAELLVSVELLASALRSARAGQEATGQASPGLVLARQQAHKLRGSAGSCGFPSVSEAAALVEDALIAASGPLPAALWARLDEAILLMRVGLREAAADEAAAG